ncbi:MAG: MarC family protein [Candidatus Diapherotrites archaeon]
MLFGDYYNFAVLCFVSLIVIINPLSKILVLPPLIGHFPKKEQTAMIRKGITIGYFLLVGFSVLGGYLLNFLEIDIFSFQIAGGIFLFYIAFDLLTGRAHEKNLEKREEYQHTKMNQIVFSPLAFPIFAGAGSIALGMLLFTQAQDILMKGVFIAVLTFIYLINYFFAVNTPYLGKIIKEEGINVIAKVFGLIIAALGIQLILIGLKTAFTALV